MSTAICPECEKPLKIKSRLHQGEHITCRACRTALEVISLDPIELDFAESLNEKHVTRAETKQRRLIRRQRD